MHLVHASPHIFEIRYRWVLLYLICPSFSSGSFWKDRRFLFSNVEFMYTLLGQNHKKPEAFGLMFFLYIIKIVENVWCGMREFYVSFSIYVVNSVLPVGRGNDSTKIKNENLLIQKV